MTRDEEIGRAAWDADGPISADMVVDTEEFTLMAYTKIALAAVSRAREIDTCETCKHQIASTDDPRGCCTEIFVMHMGDGFGCNRHQPKEA